MGIDKKLDFEGKYFYNALKTVKVSHATAYVGAIANFKCPYDGCTNKNLKHRVRRSHNTAFKENFKVSDCLRLISQGITSFHNEC